MSTLGLGGPCIPWVWVSCNLTMTLAFLRPEHPQPSDVSLRAKLKVSHDYGNLLWWLEKPPWCKACWLLNSLLRAKHFEVFNHDNHSQNGQSRDSRVWEIRERTNRQSLVEIACVQHGSLNVPIEHHPTIRYMVYNGYYKVISNIPKMGQLPTPVQGRLRNSQPFAFFGDTLPSEPDKPSCSIYPLGMTVT